MATHLRAVDPHAYYRYFLEKDIRPDGREFDKVRASSISIGCISTANGSALVKLGNTTVVCGIKAELTTPTAQEPTLGFYVPNVELPPLCSSKFRPGPPGEQAQIYTQFVLDVLENSGCIMKKDLCLEPGKLAWCLYIDVICLSYDGNILDAAILAVLGALRNTRLPAVKIEPEAKNGVTILDDLIKLEIHENPVSTSFALLFNGKIIADPTDEEEKLSESELTIVLQENGNICGIHKPGGSNISQDDLKLSIAKAKKRSKEVLQLLKESLKLLQ